MRNGVRFGFLLKSHHGLIEGNVFDGHTGPAIMMANTHQEFGGTIAREIVIRGNTFLNGYRSAGAEEDPLRHLATVAAAVTRPEGRHSILATDSRDVRHIVLADNAFIDWRHFPAVSLTGATGVVVKGNRFESSLPAVEAPVALRLEKMDDVLLEDNRFVGPWATWRDACEIDADTVTRVTIH